MSKAVFFVNWEQSPHLTQEAKESMLLSIPPWQRRSRTEGIPQLGTGTIYNVPVEEFVIENVQLQPYWPRCFSLDVGWKINAVVFGAIDKDSGTLFIYDEIYKSHSEPTVIASAIKARGNWIPGTVDPASRGRSQKDGTTLLGIYRDLGLDLRPANNAVESGILKVWEMLSQGQIKVFKRCQNLLAEYHLYRRDKNGRVVKANDHALDALRYMVMSGMDRAALEPSKRSGGRNWYDWNAADHPFDMPMTGRSSSAS